MKKEYNLEYFLDKNWSFALIRGGKILYYSKSRGLKPLIFCVKKYKTQMRDAIVFDKVIGRAAALLLVYGGVKKVMASIISRGALLVLQRGGTETEYKKTVRHILNQQKTDLCPMEKKSQSSTSEDFCREIIQASPALFVKKTKLGPGVFAGRDFKKGEKIVDFRGQHIPYEQMPFPYNQVEDHYVQIGPKLFMGPSGGIDDYFNHSCDPNSGLVIKGKKVFLKAIKNIKRGEEIVWDYSTTMYEAEFPDKWEMDCDCGSPKCRRRIVDFRDLPKKLQQKYIKAGVVPDYVIESLKK